MILKVFAGEEMPPFAALGHNPDVLVAVTEKNTTKGLSILERENVFNKGSAIKDGGHICRLGNSRFNPNFKTLCSI